MTNNSLQKVGFGPRVRILTVLIAALFAMPFVVAGCSTCHHCHVSEHPKVDANPQIVAAGKLQLDEAENVSHVWNDEKQRSLDLKVSRLPMKEGFELSRRLANLINSNKVKVDRGPLSVDPQACPCVPGICPPAAPAPAQPAVPGATKSLTPPR